uniref:Uncharacterized protein n=1 Tax=Lepeophtheirus salmonis TaxID=72036 RepID=A0A0K2UAC6_LEPSM
MEFKRLSKKVKFCCHLLLITQINTVV